MPEQFPAGTGLDALLPITIPELSDSANIQDAFKHFYYGNLDASSGSTTGTDLYNEPIAIGGYLKKLFTDKANKTDKLSVFASTTSAEFINVISDANGTGTLVFATSPTITSPTLVTPVLGVATATSINGTTIPSSKTLVTTDANQVTNTMLAGSIANSKLSNSSITIGSTSVSLGSTATTIAGLSSVTSTTFVGALTGNASTATSATTATNIAGGAAGQVVYQSASGTTAFVDSTGAVSGYVLKYNGSSAPTWANPASLAAVDVAVRADNLTGGNSTTLLGSLPYQSSVNETTLLAPNTTTTKRFLSQTGNGTNGAAPVWAAILNSDIPSALTDKTYNGLTLTSATTGFTIAGGTTSRTLTVAANASVSGTNTGDQTISLTGDVTASGGTGALTTTIGTGKVTNDMLAGSIANAKLLNSKVTVGTTDISLGASATALTGITTINSTTIPSTKTLVVTTDKISVLASTSATELRGVISGTQGTGDLVFANSPTLITPTLGAATATTINQTAIPTNKTLVTTDSTDTIAAPTTGNAGSATKAVSYGGASGTMSYPTTPANRIYVGSSAPTSGLVVGDIWMW